MVFIISFLLNSPLYSLYVCIYCMCVCTYMHVSYNYMIIFVLFYLFSWIFFPRQNVSTHIAFEEWTMKCFSILPFRWDVVLFFSFLIRMSDYTAVTAFGLNFYNPAGSTSSSTSDHWLIRLAGASERGSVVSAEPILGPSIIETPESVEHPVFGDETLTATETSRCFNSLWWVSITIQFINHNTRQILLAVLVVWKLQNCPWCFWIFNYRYINCSFISWCAFNFFFSAGRYLLKYLQIA